MEDMFVRKLLIFSLILTLFAAGCVSLGGKKISKVNYSDKFNGKKINNVAIVGFSKDFNLNYDVSNLVDKFTAELVNSDLFTLVDRKDINKVIKEVGFQVNGVGMGMLDEATMEKLRQLGADTILTGKLVTFKEQRVNNYIVYAETHLTAKLIKIETGEVIWSAEMSDNSKGKAGKKDADSAEYMLSKIVEKMSVSLKTENKIRRLIKY